MISRVMTVLPTLIRHNKSSASVLIHQRQRRRKAADRRVAAVEQFLIVVHFSDQDKYILQSIQCVCVFIDFSEHLKTGAVQFFALGE
jgi:hypothetical protein